MLNCVACRRMYARCIVVVLLALCLIAPAEGIEPVLSRQYRDWWQCKYGGNEQDAKDYAGYIISSCEKWCAGGDYTGTCETTYSVKCHCRPKEYDHNGPVPDKWKVVGCCRPNLWSTWKRTLLVWCDAERYWTLLEINEYKCMRIEWDFLNNIHHP